MCLTKGVKRRAKRKNHPNAPKQPLSPYMEFSKQERVKVINDLGVLSLPEMGKELGRRWRSLNSVEKAVYVEISKLSRKKYEEELKTLSGDGRSIDGSGDRNSDIVNEEASVPVGTLTVKDLGFARQKKYPWHPAFQTGSSAKGSRVHVTFFGSGDRGIVNKSSWLPYSEQTLSRQQRSKHAKTAAFQFGLKEMKAALEKLHQEISISSSSLVTKTAMPKRRFQRLNKDQLQLEAEENCRNLEQKMNYDEETGKWQCTDCNWVCKFKLKAKAHARTCGTRKRLNKKASNRTSFQCSIKTCRQIFSSVKDLKKHYR